MSTRRTTSRVVAIGAATVTASALVLAQAPANAAIVIGDGMAGVSLGMTRSQVRNVLGAPRRVVRGTNEFGRYRVLSYPHKVKVTVMFGAVITIWTQGRYERTDAGVGVGSTTRQVRTGVPGVTCERIGDDKVCHVGDYNPGEIVTEFRISDRRVTRALVGTVID